MRFALLGSLAVYRGDVSVDLGSVKQRLVLATLLSRPSESVPAAVLDAALWGEDPPPSAAANRRTYVRGLRNALGDGLLRAPGGYLLRVGPGQRDIDLFDQTAARGRQDLARGDSALACQELNRALELWRGPVLDGLPVPDVLTRWVSRLEERRCHAEEDFAAALLEEDRCGEVVRRMRDLVERHPLRQRAWGHLMLGLHRTGDLSGALEAYRRAREELVQETGLEPGPELARLHEDILRQRGVPTGAASEAPAAPLAATPAAGATDAEAPAAQPPSGSPALSPRQLPPVTPDFVGRDAVLAALDSFLTSTPGRPAIATIIAVTGMAGVGKSALVLHWAHRTADRFPDGQLHVNLRGYDEEGVLPATDALHGFIEALGVPQSRIPAGEEARSGLLRSLLAARRVLVVLDNARDSHHVRPLLPGAGHSVVVVTSRERLRGLVTGEGARPVGLDVLTEEESMGLLVRHLGERVVAEPAAAADIVAATGRLPLALAVVAGRVAGHPATPLRAFADELRPARALLDVLDDADARRAMSWSCRALTDDGARLFRLLGLHPGPELTPAAAAAMAGVPERDVRTRLRELTRLHLLTEQTPGRYVFHDLVRAHAAELVCAQEPAEERCAARERLYDHLLHRAHRAAVLVQPQWTAVTPVPRLRYDEEDHARDADAALAWFATELQVLLRSVTQAARHGFGTYCWQLAWAVTAYLAPHGLWQDQRAVQETALAAAERAGDPAGQAMACRLLARANSRLDGLDAAEGQMRRALDLYTALDDPAGQAQTLHNYVELCYMSGRLAEALGHGNEALRLHRLSGNRDGEARTLNAIGWLHAAEGDYERAIDSCTQALDRQRRTGDHNGQAATLDSLGYAYHRLALYDRALASYAEAVTLFRSSADRYHEAETLVRLGETYEATGRTPEAERVWRDATVIFDELHDPEADAIRERLSRVREA
ncbi:AfsR/SARP family transcriptional regulator [Streptomyces sp. OR43]|uniref:AfsR/SARP family transcriptional regulator n=1 Tax=Streptomyces sp. or43 TaxID=2478957 RepID=UPI0011CECCCC|nr:BTAD domain-containing putative transcriptional regulator [Streptomyces sp. or43]TXS34615.1 SARP family transcriptional regulator [Streptomyces sp. or43]